MKQFQSRGFKYYEQFRIMIPNAIAQGKGAYAPGISAALALLNHIDANTDDEQSFLHAMPSSQLPPRPPIPTSTDDSLVFDMHQEVHMAEKGGVYLLKSLPVDAMDIDDSYHTSTTSMQTNNPDPLLVGTSAKQKAYSPPLTISLPVDPSGVQTHISAPPSLESPVPSKSAWTASDSAPCSKAMKNCFRESSSKQPSSTASSSKSQKPKPVSADVQFHQLSSQVATLHDLMQSISKDLITEVQVKAMEMVCHDSALLTLSEQVKIILLFAKNSSYAEVLLGLNGADDELRKKFYNGLLCE